MTQKQYSFAWEISNALGIQLPRGWSNMAFNNFIQTNLPAYQEYQRNQKTIYLENFEQAKFQDIIQSQEDSELNL